MSAFHPLLKPAERFIFDVTLATAAIDAALLALKGIGFDLVSYVVTNLAAAGLVGLGIAYRKSRRSERIAASLICTGLFVAFTIWGATFNYLLMPVGRHPIDAFLARLDLLVGYRWADMLAFAAIHPVINVVFKLVYSSTLPQIAVLIAILGLSGRIRDLHVMCVTITTGALLAIMFWGLLPSVGPTWLLPRPDAAVLARVNPIIGVSGGNALYELATRGGSFIAPDDFKGLIAFPSFHTVLALALIYSARHVRWIFPIIAVVDLLVLPALLVHGSHHLVDIPGGIVVFCVALACARKIVGPELSKETANDATGVPGVIHAS
jgi:hypothetical protein